MTTDSEGDYPIDAVAAAWLIKMRGEDANVLRTELDAWLQAAPEHREAYDRARRQMSAANVLKSSARYGTAHTAKRRSRLPIWISCGAAAAAAALLIVVVGAGGASIPAFAPSGTSAAIAAEPLVTRRGEIRTFQLSDGSRATLDTDSRLEVIFGSDERRVRLVQGRARLSVKRGSSPFQIEAGRGAFVVEDADLDIRVHASGTVTALLRRGEARLRSAEADSPETRLSPGEALAYGAGPDLGAKVVPAEAIPRDWPDGWAEYRSIRLGNLVAEANRYAAVPIVIDDAETAALEVSGRFYIRETAPFTDRLARLFDLAIDRKPDAIHLRQR